MTKQTESGGIASAAALGLLSTAINGAAALARSKATALSLGPAGIGLVAEIQQILTLLSVPAVAFTGAALTRQLVTASDAGGIDEFRSQTRAAAGTTTIIVLFAGILAVVIGPRILGLTSDSLVLVAASAAAVGTATLGVYAQSLLVRGDIRRAFKTTALNTTLGAILAIMGLMVTGLPGLFWGSLVGTLAAISIAIRLLRNHVSQGDWTPMIRFDPAFIRAAIRLGGASLLASISIQLALSTLRMRLIGEGGHARNGLFQAAWALDSLMMSALTSGIASFFFPRFAATKTTEELRTEVHRALRFALAIGPAAILLFATSRNILLKIAYSADFSDASRPLALFAIGDMLKLVGWVYAGPLLYKNKIRAFLICDISAAAILGLVSFFAVPGDGLLAIGVAQILMYAAYLPLARHQLRHALGVETGLRAPAIAASMAGLAALVMLVTETYSWGWLMGIGLAATVALGGGATRQARAFLEKGRA